MEHGAEGIGKDPSAGVAENKGRTAKGLAPYAKREKATNSDTFL
jgi:hypothetical protein